MNRKKELRTGYPEQAYPGNNGDREAAEYHLGCCIKRERIDDQEQ